MAEDFSFSRDFRKIRWGATLRYNMLRALCAAVVITLVAFSLDKRGSFPIGIAIAVPIGYPFVFLPLGIALNFLGRFFWPFSLVAMSLSLIIAAGDPLVFLLHKILRNLVPVRNPAFVSFKMLIYVLDDGTESDRGIERDHHLEHVHHLEQDPYAERAKIEPGFFSVRRSATQEKLRPSSQGKPLTAAESPSTDEPGSIGHLLDISQRSPHEALAWIDRLSLELQNKATISFARFMALRTLALGNLIGLSVAGLGTSELRHYISPDSGRYLVQALRQIAELERLHPGYIASIGAPDDKFGESSMDDVCIIVERLFPGKIYEVLGWTKILYFGIDRIGFLTGVKAQIPPDLLTKLLKTRFDAGEIVRSALAITYERGNRGALGYVDFYMCRLLYSETPTIGDAQIVGTLRLSEDSNFTFIPE